MSSCVMAHRFPAAVDIEYRTYRVQAETFVAEPPVIIQVGSPFSTRVCGTYRPEHPVGPSDWVLDSTIKTGRKVAALAPAAA
eukprot:CAMPEP_0202798176 /NCGR_PEP_ID=MMETSP1388-20130828/95719_1 /ASSEMBLY_ACC=CAM_ASM_000864 /TAXON_ID=37098 /ORGANISM="Isochrysis sp, Strain CCMP1244" /LENGTH=81 /DNA_ID=CAMNT_0049468101 /DNA_START=65 /DNA_END=307 /DNA_ORIENTATION=+